MNLEEIVETLLARPGMDGNRQLITEFVQDATLEIKSYLNYGSEEKLPEGCVPAVKKLAMIHFNRDGSEGIQSESQSSGGSTTYSDEIPESIKRTIRKYRKLPGAV